VSFSADPHAFIGQSLKHEVLIRPYFFFSRFEKNDALRIVRALAIVRPSLIALQMPLSEEDEVFVEKCFQRSLLVSDLCGPVALFSLG